MRTGRRLGGWMAPALLLVACQAPPPATPIAAAHPACTVLDDTARAALTMGVLDTISPAAAPAPHNAAERLAFRQLYETLTTVTCDGTVEARLADVWTSSADQRIWQFRIRSGARFWDGSAVTARDVAASWAGAAVLPIADITVLGERELRATFTTPVAAARFADPALAIVRRNGGWPSGTGAYRVDHHDAQTLRLLATSPGTAGPDTLVFRAFAGGDARAALDAGVDLLVTADPAALAYARVLRGYTVSPVSWSRTYVLATPGAPADSVVPLAETDAARIRESLRTETRAVTEWNNTGCFRATSPAATATPRSRRILYATHDALARSIAERLVALAWPPSRAPQWLSSELGAAYAAQGAPGALGVDEKTLTDALRNGHALGVVAAIPAGGACNVLHGFRLLPLLQAREYLVQRGPAGRIVVDGDGIIRFAARAQ